MATKRHSVRIAVAVILAIIAVAVVACAFFPTTTVKIVAIDDGYDIRIRTSGRSPLPLTAEGPFAKWSELSRFTAKGPGEIVEREGVRHKKYSIGKDLTCNCYSRGSLWISEDKATLIVDAELSKENRENGIMNHSGKYARVAIDHPPIIPLTVDTPIEHIDGQYVRARGHFNDKKGLFETAGRSFPAYGAPYGGKETDTYEVVGVFHPRNARREDALQLSITIITIKKINER